MFRFRSLPWLVVAALLAACAPLVGVQPAVAPPLDLPLMARSTAAAHAPASAAEGAVVPAETAPQAVLPQTPPAECPVTLAPDPAFTPPEPWGSLAPIGAGAWHGSPALWTRVTLDGAWTDLPFDGSGYGQKVFWWREGYVHSLETEPELVVTGRRLDGEALSFTAGPATNGRSSDLGDFMLVGVAVPEPGCWEITGAYHGASLSFVVWVAP